MLAVAVDWDNYLLHHLLRSFPAKVAGLK